MVKCILKGIYGAVGIIVSGPIDGTIVGRSTQTLFKAFVDGVSRHSNPDPSHQ